MSRDDAYSERSYRFRCPGDSGTDRLLWVGLVSSAILRCATLYQHGCACVVVDWCFYILLWLPSLAAGLVPIVFSVRFGAISTISVEQDHSSVATRICLGGPFAVRRIR